MSATTSKLTRGPWVAFPSNVRLTGDARAPIFNDGRWVILPEVNVERLPIAVVDYGDDHDEETRKSAEGHARLIAAAPDLLAACELLLATYGELHALFDLGECEGSIQAREAIAKATGGAA